MLEDKKSKMQAHQMLSSTTLYWYCPYSRTIWWASWVLSSIESNRCFCCQYKKETINSTQIYEIHFITFGNVTKIRTETSYLGSVVSFPCFFNFTISFTSGFVLNKLSIWGRVKANQYLSSNKWCRIWWSRTRRKNGFFGTTRVWTM